MTRLINLIVFLPVFLVSALISLAGTLAIIYILMLGGSSILVLMTIFVSLFYWLAWVSGKRAYIYALGAPPPASAQSGFGLKGILLCSAVGVFFAAIAAPMFRDLPRKSSEGAVKGNLGAIRSALGYYAQDNGKHPTDIAELTAGGKYLTNIPTARVPYYHEATSAVAISDRPNDAGGWHYEPHLGKVRINCTHTDTRGAVWDAY